MKITVVVGTNRVGSRTAIVANKYLETLTNKGFQPQLLDLTKLFEGYEVNHPYGPAENSFEQNLNSYIRDSEKFVFVIPEYNGGYPGVLKFFIDRVPPAMLHYKKAALVGLSAGRAGNLRGLEHFTGILNYLKVLVLANKPNLSSIEKLITDEVLTDEYTVSALDKHADELINF